METKKRSYAYEFLHTYEFLLSPISTGLVGGISFGYPGLIIGLSCATVDEILTSSNIASKRYLTSVISGISSTATINKSLFSYILGGGVGFFSLQYMHTKESENFEKIITPLKSSFLGYSYFGNKGAVIGFLSGIVDELSIHYNYYNNYYLTSILSGISISKLLNKKLFVANSMLKKIPYFEESIGVLLGGIFLSVKNNTQKNLVHIGLQNDITNLYCKVLEKEEFLKITEKQTIIISNLETVVQVFSFRLVGYHQNSINAFERIYEENSWNIFKIALKNMILTLPYIYFIKQFLLEPFKTYFSYKLSYLFEDTLNDKWLKGDTALKLSFSNDYNVLIDNLKNDIQEITIQNSIIRTDFAMKLIKGSYGTQILLNNKAEDLVFLHYIYYKFTGYISEFISNKVLSYQDEIRHYSSDVINIVKHDLYNIRTITERNGTYFTRSKIQEKKEALRVLEVEEYLWERCKEVWESIEFYTEITFTHFFVGYKMLTKEIDFNVRLNTIVATNGISEVMKWEGKNIGKINKIKKAISNIEQFIYELEKPNFISSQNIERVFQEDSNLLVFSNFTLGIKDTILLKIDELSLVKGKVYALTGKSGSGKSSLLSKIKGVENNNIYANGKIMYPSSNDKKSLAIEFITQQDYFPLDSTLLEILYYPKLISDCENISILRKEVLEFLNKIQICKNEFNNDRKECLLIELLDKIEDWNNILSGGQKKKVLLISSILKKPDILLLDEVFNGLDRYSLINAQNLIKEELSNSLIINVDHQMKSNNDTGFYNAEISVHNNRILFVNKSLNDIDKKPSLVLDEQNMCMDIHFLNTINQCFEEI